MMCVLDAQIETQDPVAEFFYGSAIYRRPNRSLGNSFSSRTPHTC
jgi:hypothetical protein